jgi:nucleoside-diphosphate-sugar epimerase
MQVFVTGGTGVLGEPVIRMLREQGHQVLALAHSQASAAKLRAAGIAVVEGELFDAPFMQQVTEGMDAILHLATRIPAAADMGDPAAWEVNDRIRQQGTRVLVDAALANNVGAIVYPSVIFVYAGSGERWIDAETAVIRPESSTVSSLEAEEQLARFTNAGGRGVVLRLGLLYGPTSIHTLETLQVARDGIAYTAGSDDAFQSSIWFADAASAIVAALERAPAGVYDVVDDEPLRHRELRHAMAAAVGRPRLRPVLIGHPDGSNGPIDVPVTEHSRRVSNARFKDLTGWKPAVPNAQIGWMQLARLAPAEASV